MERTVFLSESGENPYASLPKYGADEGTLVFEEDRISHLSVNTQQSMAFSSQHAGSTEPLQPTVPDRLYSKVNKSKPSKHTAPPSLQSQQLHIPGGTFADEIRPPSLFSPDIPPAPSEMRGPVKRAQVLGPGSAQSVFTASRPGGAKGVFYGQPAGQNTNIQSNQVFQAPQFLSVPMNTVQQPAQGVYVPQSNPLSGYKVPGTIATSMTQQVPITKKVEITSKANQKCWRSFLMTAVLILVVVVLGAAVAAIVLTQV